MLTPIPCPKCNVRLQTPENLLGKVIQCPKCKKAVRLGSRRNGTAPAAPAKPFVPEPESPDKPQEIDDFVSRLERVDDIGAMSDAPPLPDAAAPSAPADDDIEKMLADVSEEMGEHKEPAQDAAIGDKALEETLLEAPVEEEVLDEAPLDEEAVEEVMEEAPLEEETVEEAPVEEAPVEETVDEVVDEEVVEDEVAEEPAAEDDVAVVDNAEEKTGQLSKAVQKFLAANLFLIKGQSGLFSINAAWDFLNPDTKKKIGTAVERPQGILQVLRFFLRRNWLPSKIEVREEKTNELVFIVRRPAYFFNCTLEVRDADNKVLAKFTYKPLSRMLGKPMPIERKGGEKFGTCEFYFLKGRVDLMDDNKKELANMQTESAYTKAIKIYWAARGGSYYITFNKPLFDKPHDKMIFLGVTLAMDLLQEDAKASAGKGGGITLGS